jgi:hypothetical protein
MGTAGTIRIACLIRNADGPGAGQMSIAYLISNADGSAGNDKLSLYNASVIMALVQTYYYAAMRIQRYGDMTIEAYNGSVMKW